MFRGIQSQLTPRTLTVLSIDNIDLMQINAMVSALHAKRSWHGTSVQCVQPLPTSSILCDEEMTSPPSTPKQASSTSSPVVKHLDKRRRTLKEHAPSTVVVVPKETSVTMNVHDYADYLKPTISQFTIDNFLVLQEEEEQLDLCTIIRSTPTSLETLHLGVTVLEESQTADSNHAITHTVWMV